MGEIVNPTKLYLPDEEEGVDIEQLNENFRKLNRQIEAGGSVKDFNNLAQGGKFWEGNALGGSNADTRLDELAWVPQGDFAYLYIRIRIQRNLTMDGGTGGLSSPLDILTLNAGFRPKFDTGLVTILPSDRIVGGAVSTNGKVLISALSGSVAPPTGTNLKFQALFLRQ